MSSSQCVESECRIYHWQVNEASEHIYILYMSAKVNTRTRNYTLNVQNEETASTRTISLCLITISILYKYNLKWGLMYALNLLHNLDLMIINLVHLHNELDIFNLQPNVSRTEVLLY